MVGSFSAYGMYLTPLLTYIYKSLIKLKYECLLPHMDWGCPILTSRFDIYFFEH